MIRVRKTLKLNVLYISMILLLVAIFAAAVEHSCYAKETYNCKLNVKQIISVDGDGSKPKFAVPYKLEKVSPNAPMPENTDNNVYSFSIKGQTEYELALNFTESGEYTYNLYQEKPENISGFTGNNAKYKLIFTAVKQPTGEIKVSKIIIGEDGCKHEEAEFKNGYKPPKISDVVKEPRKIIDIIKTLPKTGKISYLSIFVGANIISLGFIIFLILFMKKKKDEDENEKQS